MTKSLKVCAVYGFNFTKEFTAAGLTFMPLQNQQDKAEKNARDQLAYHLTGTVSGVEFTNDTRFYLAAVLSFIERLDVRLSDFSESEDAFNDPFNHFEKMDCWERRNSGGGAVICADRFGPHENSRKNFIHLAMSHLANDEFCSANKFRLLFFKFVESFRQRNAYLEISYFLLISGLEAFARASQSDNSKHAAPIVCRSLINYGFNVCCDDPKNLPRAITTYFQIRNAIFHNGELSPKINLNNSDVILESAKYLYNLQMLVCLTIMKIVKFEDSNRNWDSWIDRQLYHASK